MGRGDGPYTHGNSHVHGNSFANGAGGPQVGWELAMVLAQRVTCWTFMEPGVSWG